MFCPSRGEEESRAETGGLSPAAERAAQAVMRAATADPLSDSQLDWVVKLAPGKRVPAANATSGGDSSQASAPAMELTDDHQGKRRVESEDKSESRASDPTGPEGSPPEGSRVRPASPEPQGVAAQ